MKSLLRQLKKLALDRDRPMVANDRDRNRAILQALIAMYCLDGVDGDLIERSRSARTLSALAQSDLSPSAARQLFYVRDRLGLVDTSVESYPYPISLSDGLTSSKTSPGPYMSYEELTERMSSVNGEMNKVNILQDRVADGGFVAGFMCHWVTTETPKYLDKYLRPEEEEMLLGYSSVQLSREHESRLMDILGIQTWHAIKFISTWNLPRNTFEAMGHMNEIPLEKVVRLFTEEAPKVMSKWQRENPQAWQPAENQNCLLMTTIDPESFSDVHHSLISQLNRMVLDLLPQRRSPITTNISQVTNTRAVGGGSVSRSSESRDYRERGQKINYRMRPDDQWGRVQWLSDDGIVSA